MIGLVTSAGLADAAGSRPVDEVAQMSARRISMVCSRVVPDPHPLEELLHQGDHPLRVVGVADGLLGVLLLRFMVAPTTMATT